MRLLTLNAHQGFSALGRERALHTIREGLRDIGADLVFLQEIGAAAGSDKAATQYELLADTVWPQHAYGQNAVTAGGHHGNALLSKFPIASWRNVDVSQGRSEPRGLLHCVLDVPGSAAALHAICAHFGLRESHRRRQAARLIELVEDQVPDGAPLVIAGDFNDWRGRGHDTLVRALRLESVGRDARGRPPRTFPARLPFLRLDRIYVRNLRHRDVVLPRRPWAVVSDHLALAADAWCPGLTA